MAEEMTTVNLAAFDLSNDTDRLVLADLLAENDRKQEEALCRDTATRLAVHEGKVIRALRLEVIAFLKEVGEPHGVVVDPVTHDPAVATRVRLHYLPIAHARPDAAKRCAQRPAAWLGTEQRPRQNPPLGPGGNQHRRLLPVAFGWCHAQAGASAECHRRGCAIQRLAAHRRQHLAPVPALRGGGGHGIVGRHRVLVTRSQPSPLRCGARVPGTASARSHKPTSGGWGTYSPSPHE